MEIKLEQINGVDVAVLIGEINGHTAPTVQEKLLPMVTADCRVLLDMRQVTYSLALACGFCFCSIDRFQPMRDRLW